VSLWQDVRYSFRTVRRSPRVAVTVLLTLALGIGANTAIFSIVNAALLRPLPYREPGKLVQLSADLPGVGSHNVGFSVPEFDDFRERAGVFEGVSVSWQAPANLTGGSHPERIEFLAVSPNYFSLLGANPQMGRLFDARDTANGFAEAAVISDAYWHKEFGGDPNIAGRRVRLDNDLYTIVGVLPPAFRPPVASTVREVDAWITAGFKADPFPPAARSARFLPAIVARLKPGISLPQAQAQLAIFANSLRHDFPGDYPAASGWTLSIAPLKDVVVGNSRTLLISLLLAVGFILLIACVNVANILLANASVRQQEIAIRIAMGADRRRIVRQLLTESALLSLAATIMGAGSAAISLRFFASLLPSQLPHVNTVAVDGRVLAFSLVVALFTTVGFGLMPAVQASKTPVDIEALRGRGMSQSLRGRRLGKILVGAEVALSLMLLVGAGLLLRTFWELLRVDPGFQPNHLIAANVWLPVPNDPKNDAYAKAEPRANLIRESLRRLEALPGVQGAAISSAVPLQDSPQPAGFRVEGVPEAGDAPTAVRVAVTRDFFKTLGASVITGRAIEETDTTDKPLVALVDQAAAHRFWGDRNPIGQRLHIAQSVGFNGRPLPIRWMTVVGVVSNMKLASLDEHAVPHVYNSMYQTPGRLFGILVRATGDRAELGRAIQREVQSVDPDLPVANIAEMKEIVNNGVGDRQFAAWLLGIFAGVALLLTSVGIYGVTSYAIARRTKEMGIRSALGAMPGDLVRMLIVNGMMPIIAGALAGLIGAMLSARLIAALLYSVSSTDAAVYTAAGAMVVMVGVGANYIPARRAARVNPIAALRVE
jgi:predicted permease